MEMGKKSGVKFGISCDKLLFKNNYPKKINNLLIFCFKMVQLLKNMPCI